MEDEFNRRKYDMAKSIIRRLILRGVITGNTDALAKISNTAWIEDQGYGSVADILAGAIGTKACCDVFAEASNGGELE